MLLLISYRSSLNQFKTSSLSLKRVARDWQKSNLQSFHPYFVFWQLLIPALIGEIPCKIIYIASMLQISWTLELLFFLTIAMHTTEYVMVISCGQGTIESFEGSMLYSIHICRERNFRFPVCKAFDMHEILP
jgi:hypothetical protein